MPGAFLYEPNSGILDMNYESSYESIGLRMGKLVKNKKSILRKLFFSCLYLSTFTFGGGYVIVTLMKKKFVDDYHWIEENEMLDLVAIAQSSPGPIAVNGAIVIGYKLAGILGAVTAILGTIIPPFLIISVISVGYHSFSDSYFISQILEGMQAGVGAVIASVVYEMGVGIAQEKDKISLLIMAGYIRIYRSGYDLSDDSGANLNKCGDFCWNQNCRDSGSNCSYRRMCPAILCDRYDHCESIFEV